MPKPRYGIIPSIRLSDARKVRNTLRLAVGNEGLVMLSILNGEYCVIIRIYQDSIYDVTNLILATYDVPVILKDRVKRVVDPSSKK